MYPKYLQNFSMKAIKTNWLLLLQFTVYLLICAVASSQLKADFTSIPKNGCPPMVVNFFDSSSGNPTAWKWDLGNGTTSVLKNPVTTYFDAGTYNIKLIVTGANGVDSIVKNQYIVINALPTPVFTVSDTAGCYPLKLRFDDGSFAGSGSISLWQWDFGDGTLSNDPSPIHTYTSAGNFSVLLRITNTNGCSKVITKPNLIKIQNGVKAVFSYNSNQGCQTSAPVTFINQSTGTGSLSYLWSFGNGKSSTLQNPVNNYNSAGSYTVRLIVTNSFGCADTLLKPNAINIGVVKADFSKPDTVCTGANFQLKNTSSPGSFVSSFWSFGDGSNSTDVFPEYAYSVAGTYQVKLVTDFGSCKDSTVKSIISIPKPKAAFTATNYLSCKAPLTTAFNNNSVGGVSFQWDFGDGGTSTSTNPTHTYTSLGNYSVKLIITNAKGCTDTLLMDQLVKIAPPEILGIDSLPAQGCIPFTTKPIPVIQTGLPVSSYLWNFGDGSTSTDSLPTHVYTTPGVYNIKLTISTGAGCTDTLTVLEAVKAGNRPNANFSATPLDVCANTSVNFTDLSTGSTVNDWFWDFGDGTTIYGVQHPTHMYNDTGRFDVMLVAYNFGCSDTLIIKKYVRIKPPIARFDTAYACGNPLRRNFLDSSIGATSWAWNFGDGGTSSLQNPFHNFASSGIYPVTLTVSDGSCQHTTIRNVRVLKQTGNMVINDSIGCRATRLTFNVSGLETGSIQKYKWFFEGLNKPGIGTSNVPVAQSYSTPGVRNPAVIVTDILNCLDTLFTVYPVTIYGPKVAFGSDTKGSCFGGTINFLDSTVTDGIHPITKWTWYYGDGPAQNYTNGPFAHLYPNQGKYNVSLVVKDSYGCKDSLTKPSYISISQAVADFIPSDTMLCPGVPLVLTNNSAGTDVTYKWDFGDNIVSNVVSPTHNYASSGTYIVSLVVSDKTGCRDSIAKTIKVFLAKADFTVSDSFSTCPPLVVNATNNSSNYISFNWDFGDGSSSSILNPSHIYTYPGTYIIKLSVLNNGGCTDTVIKKIVVNGPTGSYGYIPTQACNPGTIHYSIISQNAINFVWDFSDGTTIFSTKDTISHTYNIPGFYVPKVILENANGCKVAILGLDTVKITDIQTHILANKRIFCDSGSVSFTDSTITNDVINSYIWHFGDGTTSNSQNPTHFYSKSGYYSVTFITGSQFGCVDTAKVNDYVKITSTPKIKITGDSAACEPAQILFAGVLQQPDTSTLSWKWTFGNGNSSSFQNPPPQMYNNAGNYNIKLIATKAEGCADTATAKAVIHSKPIVDASADTAICKNQQHTLIATGATSYLWSSNATLSCLNCDTTRANPIVKTTYYVTGTTAKGCTNTDSVTIDVRQPFTITIGQGDTICVGETVPLTASGADRYDWSPSRWLSNPFIENPTTRPDSSITYTVVGSDFAGCFKDTGTVKIKVYPIPTVEITNGENVNLEISKSVKLTTKISSDVTNLTWSPTQALSCNTCGDPIASPRENITYTVTASNGGNCTAKDQVNILMVCGSANVFIPNTFSPNNDGMNDVFYPRGAGLSHIRSFRIFNRWGQMVFQKLNMSANDASMGWDGKLNGTDALSDVYVYILEVICINNEVMSFKGNVSLLR